MRNSLPCLKAALLLVSLLWQSAAIAKGKAVAGKSKKPNLAQEEFFGRNTHLWSLAEDPVADLRGAVVQRRKYNSNQQLAFSFSYLPNSPYYRGYGLDFSYRTNLSTLWSWEWVDAALYLNPATNLRKQLLEITASNQQAAPPMPRADVRVGTNLIFTPIYGKQALWNLGIFHSEIYLFGGPLFLMIGDLRRSWQPNVGLNVGLGAAGNINKRYGIRLQLGEILYFYKKALVPTLHMEAGVTVFFGGAS